MCVPRRHRDSVRSLLESVESQYNPLSWSRCTAVKKKQKGEKVEQEDEEEKEEATLDTPGRLIN